MIPILGTILTITFELAFDRPFSDLGRLCIFKPDPNNSLSVFAAVLYIRRLRVLIH
jgi:hypothetical protein